MRPWPRPSGIESAGYVAQAEEILNGRIPIFRATAVVDGYGSTWSRDPDSGVVSPLRPGPFIDYRDSAVVGNARNVWELNRQFHLVTLSQAFTLTGDERYRLAASRMLESWLRECPYPLGINWVSALELGIRLVNWYLASRLCGWWRDGSEPVAGWRDSIYWHCKFIDRHRSRHSSANNHLLGEMAGLYVASTAWALWDESERWRRKARRVLLDELPRQVHADGVSREQTVDYQMFVLQMLLIAGLVGEEAGDPFPSGYWTVVERMLSFLCSIADAGGHLPAFGDSDDGMLFMLAPDARDSRLGDLLAIRDQLDGVSAAAGASNPAIDTSAVATIRPSAAVPAASATAAWIGSGFSRPVNWPPTRRERIAAFPEGGYYVLGDRFGRQDEVLLVADAAPLGFLSIAAHGHADCLSFVLSLGGVPILIDPGTFCYHSDPTWREYFRGTSAHNTVRVDGLNQSESAGPFMWSRKAVPRLEAFDAAARPQRLAASHDGYLRLEDPVRHGREILLDVRTAEITVIDTLECVGTHRVERFWHFSDDCVVDRANGGTFNVHVANCSVELSADDAQAANLYRGSTEPISGWISRRFGVRTPAPTVVMANPITAQARLVTRIRWRFT